MSFVSNKEAVRARCRSALRESMSEAGDRIVSELQQSLGEAYPPPSSPGNPPHQRTGLLRAGINQSTSETERGVRTSISSSRLGRSPVPLFLEKGTSRGLEPRPFMRPSLLRWTGKLLAELQQQVRGFLG